MEPYTEIASDPKVSVEHYHGQMPYKATNLTNNVSERGKRCQINYFYCVSDIYTYSISNP